MTNEIPGILRQVKTLLGDAELRWAVCGGYALELYLGHPIRDHGDLDLSVPEENREQVLRVMLEKGWQVYEFRGQGRMRPLRADTPSEKGRNLMCVRDGCELVTFWPCEEPGFVLHEWHPVGIRELNYMEFLFHERSEKALLVDASVGRELDRAILRRDGIPFLAPELVLLYKAESPMREVNARDFEAVFPALEEEGREWLLRALRERYPAGHPWLKEDVSKELKP